MTVADMLNTYTTIANREDLSDVIADLFADEVPFFAMAQKIKAEGTTHEWTADNLAAGSTTAIVEGASVTYTKPALRTRHKNYTHIRLRNWEVTHTQQAVRTAGIKNDVKRELMKAMKTLLRDYDKIFLNSAQTSAGSTAAGRVARGDCHYQHPGRDAAACPGRRPRLLAAYCLHEQPEAGGAGHRHVCG